jgi:hypothetical protein
MAPIRQGIKIKVKAKIKDKVRGEVRSKVRVECFSILKGPNFSLVRSWPLSVRVKIKVKARFRLS